MALPKLRASHASSAKASSAITVKFNNTRTTVRYYQRTMVFKFQALENWGLSLAEYPAQHLVRSACILAQLFNTVSVQDINSLLSLQWLAAKSLLTRKPHGSSVVRSSQYLQYSGEVLTQITQQMKYRQLTLLDIARVQSDTVDVAIATQANQCTAICKSECLQFSITVGDTLMVTRKNRSMSLRSVLVDVYLRLQIKIHQKMLKEQYVSRSSIFRKEHATYSHATGMTDIKSNSVTYFSRIF